MRRYRPFGHKCPLPVVINRAVEVCGGELYHEDYPGWTYIECRKCGHRWVKDHPQRRRT